MTRFFFVTYCFGDYQGQSLIGVYKRGLRIALELADRGHEVVFFCTGREAFSDDLTRQAEQRLTFVDIPFEVAAFEEAARAHVAGDPRAADPRRGTDHRVRAAAGRREVLPHGLEQRPRQPDHPREPGGVAQHVIA